MSRQIAVRLPDDVVERIDGLVADGQAPSRAALVASALEREFSRRLAMHDVEILLAEKAAGTRDELQDLAEWNAKHSASLD